MSISSVHCCRDSVVSPPIDMKESFPKICSRQHTAPSSPVMLYTEFAVQPFLAMHTFRARYLRYHNTLFHLIRILRQQFLGRRSSKVPISPQCCQVLIRADPPRRAEECQDINALDEIIHLKLALLQDANSNPVSDTPKPMQGIEEGIAARYVPCPD